MNRIQLEHLIRAAGTITNEDELIIIGSQSILGQFPDVPELAARSMEADIIVVNHPEHWEKARPSMNNLVITQMA